MAKKYILWILVGIIVVAGGAFFFGGNGEETDIELYTVMQTDVVREISETAVVRPATAVDLTFEIPGQVARISVTEGQTVSQGQELVRLNQSDLLLQVNQAEAALTIAQASLNKLVKGATPEDVQIRQASVNSAEVSLANAWQALADAHLSADNSLSQKYGDVPDILNDAYLKADDALHKYADALFTNDDTPNPSLNFTAQPQAQNDAEWKRVLAGSALTKLRELKAAAMTATHSELDAALTEAYSSLNVVSDFLSAAATALNEAIDLNATTQASYKTNIATARTSINTELSTITTQQQTIASTKVANQKSINAAQATVRSAEAALQAAQTELTRITAPARQEDIDLARGQLQQAQAALDLAEQKLRQSVVRSPISGTVVSIPVEPGENVLIGQAAASVDARSSLTIKADIYEEDLVEIEIGDPATITLVPYPDTPLTGTVTSIDPSEKTVNGVVYYEVEVNFENTLPNVRPGMSADIDILTDKRENVIAVPDNAVRERDEGDSVQLYTAQGTLTQPIEIGLKGTNGYYQVLSGLNIGDAVVLP